MTFEIKLKKASTGEVVVYEQDFDDELSALYLYTKGNYSCDCNRELFFCEAKGLKEPEESECGDNERFTLVSITRKDGDTKVLDLSGLE